MLLTISHFNSSVREHIRGVAVGRSEKLSAIGAKSDDILVRIKLVKSVERGRAVRCIWRIFVSHGTAPHFRAVVLRLLV